jgi:hypothetical protein
MSALCVMKACDAHRPPAQWAYQREHLVDAGNQHGAKVVRRVVHELDYLKTLTQIAGERATPSCFRCRWMSLGR